MSSNDSSSLIDAPAASKLGENRALYFSEEENRIEKFRPYGIPEEAWLDQVKRLFASRPVPAAAAQPNGEPRATVAAAAVAVPIGVGGNIGDGEAACAASDDNGPAAPVESRAPAGDEAEAADRAGEAL
jgi:hypothetical protein